MVIEMDTRDFKKMLDRRRLVLSVLFAISILPLIFDPIEIGFSLLAIGVNAFVWLTWLIETVGKIRDVHYAEEVRKTQRSHEIDIKDDRNVS